MWNSEGSQFHPTNKKLVENLALESQFYLISNLSNMLYSSFQFTYLSSLLWLTYKIGVSSFWTTPINAFPALCYLTLQWRLHMSDMNPPSASATTPKIENKFFTPKHIELLTNAICCFGPLIYQYLVF